MGATVDRSFSLRKVSRVIAQRGETHVGTGIYSKS